MNYQIISDGSCDLAPETAAAHNIKIVPFYVAFEEEPYQKEIEEIAVRDFYQKMVDHPHSFPKSSLPNVTDYLAAFRPYVEQNIPIICLCITAKFSGSYAAACNAKELLLGDYENAKITVIDTTVNTVLQGILVLEAAKMQKAGMSYEETIHSIEEIRSSGRIFFTIGSMDYLGHGGRVGKLVGVVGKSLGIRPLITLKEGEIFPSGIALSRNKSKDKVIEMVKKHFVKHALNPDAYTVVVGYGYDYEEAAAFRDRLLASLQEYSHIKTLELYQIGATIGVHTGPYPLGVGILKKVC